MRRRPVVIAYPIKQEPDTGTVNACSKRFFLWFFWRASIRSKVSRVPLAHSWEQRPVVRLMFAPLTHVLRWM